MFTYHDAYNRFLSHFPVDVGERLKAGAKHKRMSVFDDWVYYYRIPLGEVVPSGSRSTADCVDIRACDERVGHIVVRVFRYGTSDIEHHHADTPEMLDSLLALYFAPDGVRECKKRRILIQ